MIYFIAIFFIVSAINGVSAELTKFNYKLSETIQCTTPNMDTGICMPVKECKIILEQLIRENKSAYKFIKDSRCEGADRTSKVPWVCCGLYGDYKDSDDEKTPMKKPGKRAANPFPANCGIQKNVITNRVVGGSPAGLGEFPWMARLKSQREDGITQYGCVGFLVAPSYVLTAAHCLTSKNMLAMGKLYEVQLGEYNTEMYEDCVETPTERFCADQPQYIKAGKPIIHPQYVNTSISFHHDIAIIPLKEPANFTDFVQPICLSEKPTNEDEMWISGWGKTENSSSSKIKLKAAIRREDTTYCRHMYRNLGVELIEGQICAGRDQGIDSCAGDSGGPLMVQRGAEPFEAEGIVSFGYKCGEDGWPGIYLNIPTYYPWIKKMINRHMRMAEIRTRFRSIIQD